jgi:hypothetical protein|tara:strand:- start:572 stop:994 length:423 start_codon:yes stop_codon:yes gene_type:complete
MINFYLTFDTETGQVISYQSSIETEEKLRDMVQEYNPTWDVSPVEEAEALTAYMIQVEGVWEKRQKTSLTATWDAETLTANGTAEIVLSTLPIPCTVHIDNEILVVEDGSLEFSTKDIGFYKVTVNEPAYLPKEWTINAV